MVISDWEFAIDFVGIRLYNVMYDIMIGRIGETRPVMKYLMTIKEVIK